MVTFHAFDHASERFKQQRLNIVWEEGGGGFKVAAKSTFRSGFVSSVNTCFI